MQQHVSVSGGGGGKGGLAWLTTRFGKRPIDLLFRGITLLFVLIVLAVILGVALVLMVNAWPTITTFGWSFLTNQAFDPVHANFGVGPAIFGTLVTSAFALLLTVPTAQREAMLALGATRWEVIRYAVLPFSRVGILGGVILALGRALGETMAVTMVIGNQASKPSLSLFQTGYTLSSVIANQFGEATPGVFLSAVIEAGLIVFIITLITNVLARVLISSMQLRGARGVRA